MQSEDAERTRGTPPNEDDAPQTGLYWICALAGTITVVGTAIGLLCVWERLSALEGSLFALSESVRIQGRVLEQLKASIYEARADQNSEEGLLASCCKGVGQKSASGFDSYDDEDYFRSAKPKRAGDSNSWPWARDSLWGDRGDRDLYDIYGDYSTRRRQYGRYDYPLSSYDSFYGRSPSMLHDDLDLFGYGGSKYLGHREDDDFYDSYDSFDSNYRDSWYGGLSSSYGVGSIYGSRGKTPDQQQKDLERQFRNRSKALSSALWRGIGGEVVAAESCLWGIPRVLHQTWKTDEVPAKFADHLASWRRLHRHWRIEFWDDRRSEKMMAENFPKYFKAYQKMSGIKRADVIRIALLYLQGGVYADIDVEAVTSFDPLIDAAARTHSGVLLGEENFIHSVLLEQRSTWLVSNAVMASAKGHPFWLDALREIFATTWCGDDPVQCTGPRLVDRLSWDHLRRAQACGPHGCIVRLPFAYFSPHIARWNAKNMVRECGLQSSDAKWRYSYRKRSQRLVKRACKALEQTLSYPAALRSYQTHAVHHWQCSWCREDPSMKGTIQLAQVIWRVGNESSSRRRRRRRRSVNISSTQSLGARR